VPNDRKKALEEFSKRIMEGTPYSEDLIGKTSDIENDALRARNLSEDSLAHNVLKNTGVPIPGKEASRSKQEDFLNRIIKEQYSDMEPDVRLEKMKSAANYGDGKIGINQDLAKIWTPEQTAGKAFHEAGHYSDELLGKAGKNLDLATLRKAKAAGVDLKKMDPTDVYELYAKSHHADRAGKTFGTGALESYLKKGSFRGMAPLLAGGAGLALSAAAEAADTEESGEGPEQAAMLREIDERNRRKKNLESSPEIQAASKKMYEEADTGKMFDPRRDALRNILRNRNGR
jgi:hypothetical protein